MFTFDHAITSGEPQLQSLRRMCAITVLAAAMAAACGHASTAGIGGALPPGEQCQAAIAAAERAQRIPPHLVAAIGRIESGRKDPITGRWTPWPWTIDIGGQGAFFPTRQAAIDAVRALQAQGVLSIDVGCLQINLSYHGGAFSNLQQAFDPMFNVAYGTRLLEVLFQQTGNWGIAVGRYHSTTAALADDYEQKVMDAWSGAANEPPALTPLQALARAWAATLGTSPAVAAKPVWTVPTVTGDVAHGFPPHRRTALSPARTSETRRLPPRKPTAPVATATRSPMSDGYDTDRRM